MTVGTRSVLFGAHAFWLHPFIVAISWIRLYGVRVVRCPSTGVRTSIFDLKLWILFFVHDLGYIGKPNMDGDEGELHPLVGARIMGTLADCGPWHCWKPLGEKALGPWGCFTLFHSRFYARKVGHEPSLCCWADKMAIALTPSWIYIPLTTLTGELREYMHVNPREVKGHNKSAWQWHKECKRYCRALALEHKDGRIDTWTPKAPTTKEP
jgi:hypothetical protein